MIIHSTILTITRPHDVAARAWSRTICPPAFQAMGEYWVQKFFPLHFKRGAEQRYAYARRSWKYLQLKRKRGVSDPLTFTGRLRTLAQNTVKVKGYATRCTVKFAVPNYAPLRKNLFTGRDRKGKQRKASPQPDKVKEMTTVTEVERRELIGVLEREIVAGIARVREKRVLRIQ
jgi:hypothetical protein